MVKGIIGKKVGMTQLFDENGTLIPELQALAPKGNRRMGANPHANSWASARFPPRRSTRQLQVTSRRQTLPPRRPCASSVWRMSPQ